MSPIRVTDKSAAAYLAERARIQREMDEFNESIDSGMSAVRNAVGNAATFARANAATIGAGSGLGLSIFLALVYFGAI